MTYNKQTISPDSIAHLLKMDLSVTSTKLSSAIAQKIASFPKEQQENCVRNIENILIALKELS